MTIELQCVKCKKRSDPEVAFRRQTRPGLCKCGGAFRITSCGRFVGTKPVEPPTPAQTVSCPNCGTVLFGTAEPLPQAVFPRHAGQGPFSDTPMTHDVFQAEEARNRPARSGSDITSNE